MTHYIILSTMAITAAPSASDLASASSMAVSYTHLVHIPHQDKPGAHVYCPQQGMHKADVHHGHFIYNDDIGIQRCV